MDQYDRQHRRSRAMVIASIVILVVLGAIVLLGGTAHADPRPSQTAATSGQTPGGECTTAGATFTRHGAVYECVRKPWDDCLRWHHRKPAGYQPPATWTRPAQRPCTACTPTPSTPTTTPPATPSVPSASAPSVTLPTPANSAAPTPPRVLAVTGTRTLIAVTVGLVGVIGGALLLFYGRSTRERDPHERVTG